MEDSPEPGISITSREEDLVIGHRIDIVTGCRDSSNVVEKGTGRELLGINTKVNYKAKRQDV
jgi:hypothetical protein